MSIFNFITQTSKKKHVNLHLIRFSLIFYQWNCVDVYGANVNWYIKFVNLWHTERVRPKAAVAKCVKLVRPEGPNTVKFASEASYAR